MAGIDLAGAGEGRIAGSRVERDCLGDVHVENAVAVILELQPPELGELSVPDHLDPLGLPAAGLAAATAMQLDVATEGLDGRSGLLLREPKRAVLLPELRDSRDERARERVVLETKLH
jgi:hypothetical protein